MSKSSSVSAIELLQIVFVALKLCGVIDWSWWIVLLPTLIPVALAIVCLLIVHFVIR